MLPFFISCHMQMSYWDQKQQIQIFQNKSSMKSKHDQKAPWLVL